MLSPLKAIEEVGEGLEGRVLDVCRHSDDDEALYIVDQMVRTEPARPACM